MGILPVRLTRGDRAARDNGNWWLCSVGSIDAAIVNDDGNLSSNGNPSTTATLTA